MTPSEAHARRRGIPILFQTGDYVFHLADVPDDAPCRSAPGIPSDVVVGYKCERFAVLWMELWTWSGEFCLYSEEANMVWTDFTTDELAMLASVPAEKIKKPFLYSVPLGWIVLGGLVGLGIAYKAIQAGSVQPAGPQTFTPESDTQRPAGT